MNFTQFTAVILGSLLLTSCATLEQWEEDLGLSAAESSNRHYPADKIPKTKVKAEKKAKAMPTYTATPKVVNTTVQTKRINTTDCKDSDDWYLDGYRVGKSFRTQKEQMLQQRSQYCGYSVKQLPAQHRNNWERGFRVGTKS